MVKKLDTQQYGTYILIGAREGKQTEPGNSHLPSRPPNNLGI